MQRRHQLAVLLPHESLWLHADPTRLEQILTNLLHNAAKYTPEGGMIALSAERDRGEVVVRVRDNGIGIRADMLARVFELFVQSEQTLDRAQGGLGIGLTLVKRLVEMHGGVVAAQSAGPGQGSEFMVRLPALTQGAPQNNGHAANGAMPSGRLRVLVVDDNTDAADSLAMLLRMHGHEVRTAHEGQTALQAVDGFVPQIVFLDIGLPDMDGYEVARRLRHRPELRKAVLVALTGYGQDSDRLLSREAGFDAHVVKPAMPEALEQVLQQAAGASR